MKKFDPTLEETFVAAGIIIYASDICPRCGKKIADIGQNVKMCCELFAENKKKFWNEYRKEFP